MKKLLAGLFIFGALFIGAQQVHASVISDALLQIKNLKNQILNLKPNLKASVLDSSITVTPTSDLTPRISVWSGKVNQHVDIDSSEWQTDPDGSSGAGIDKLTYCKKWYPNTASVVEYKNETINSWHNGGNTGNYVSTKMSYKCVQQAITTPTSPVTPTGGGGSGTSIPTYPYICPPNMPGPILCSDGSYSRIEAKTKDSNGCTTAYSFICPTPAPTIPSITITSPNGGETYKLLDVINVKWKYNGIATSNDTVKIFLKDTKNNKIYTMCESCENSGLANVGIPHSWGLAEGNIYKLSVRVTDSTGFVSQDETDNLFTITSSTTPTNYSVIVLSPNGEEVYYLGDNNSLPNKIKIISSKIGSINVFLVENPYISNPGSKIFLNSSRGVNAAFFKPQDYIDSSTTGLGSGMIKPGKYYIMAEWKSDDGLENSVDFSDGYFTIKPASIDTGCSNGQVYSSTTGQSCPVSGDPVISGVSGPQSLAVHEMGTWTVKASNPKGGNLSYSVDWGELQLADSTIKSGSIPQQTAVFTHTYSTSGTYKPVFTVTNSAGKSISTSLSVNVISKYDGCSNGEVYSSATGQPCPNNNDSYVKLVYPKSGSVFRAGESVEIKIDSNLTRLGAFRALIYRKDINGRYIFIKKFDTANSGVQILKIPLGTQTGEYKIEYGHILSENDYKQYGTATFNVASNYTTEGCTNGAKYSSLNGLICDNYNSIVDTFVNSCGQTLFTDLLRIGSTGNQVESLQVLLNDQGFLLESDIDGSFGYKTWKALKAFQISKGLKGDGIMGKQTRAFFNKLWNDQCLADQSNG